MLERPLYSSLTHFKVGCEFIDTQKSFGYKWNHFMFPVNKSLDLKKVKEMHYRIRIYPLSLPDHRFFYMANPYFIFSLMFIDDDGFVIGELNSHDLEKLQQN